MIDEKIEEVKENVIKGEGEIKEAEQETRGTSKKVYYLIALIVFVVAAIILILYFSLH